MTCKKRTYQNILILLLCLFQCKLRALRGYKILYFGYIRYFFEKNLDNNFVTSRKTILINSEKFQRWESLLTFSQEIRQNSQTMITNFQGMNKFYQ